MCPLRPVTKNEMSDKSQINYLEGILRLVLGSGISKSRGHELNKYLKTDSAAAIWVDSLVCSPHICVVQAADEL